MSPLASPPLEAAEIEGGQKQKASNIECRFSQVGEACTQNAEKNDWKT